MRIKYAKTAVKVINPLDTNTKLRIKKEIEGLTQFPLGGDIKQLKGLAPPQYRLRVGKIYVTKCVCLFR